MDPKSCFVIVLLLFHISGIESSNASVTLLNHLLNNYQLLSRPVTNESEALTIRFGITILQIIDLYEREGILKSSIWESVEWVDEGLVWDPKDYGNIAEVMIPPHRIWKPDIHIYNSVDPNFDGTYYTNAVVKHNGSITYIPPGIHSTSCRVQYNNFPFDEQKCEIKFGSWTSHGGRIDIQLQHESNGDADISSYLPHANWALISATGRRNSIHYACCPDPYVDITYVIHLKRRGEGILAQAKSANAFICFTLVLSFLIPASSQHKITFAVLHLINIYFTIWFLTNYHPGVTGNSTYGGGPLIVYFERVRELSEFTLGVNVFTFWLYGKYGRIPQWVRSIILERLPKVGLLMGMNRKASTTASTADGIELMNEGNQNDAGARLRYQSDWSFIATMLDRFFLVVFAFVAIIMWAFAFPSFSDAK